MKSKLLNLGLLITSLLGYHEWGGDNSSFIFQMEWEVISKMLGDFSAGNSPFVIIPLLGQILLAFTLFQKTPSRRLTYIGIGMLGLLLFFIFLIGIMTLNYKTVLSFLPFVFLVVITIKHHRSLQGQQLSA